MDELSPPETRRRSRSKTPFLLRSNCDKINCTEGDHSHAPPVKKTQTVQTIIEDAEQSPAAATQVRSATRTNRTSKLIEGAATAAGIEHIQSNIQTITSSSKVTSTVVVTAATSSQGESSKIDSTSRQHSENTPRNISKRVTSTLSKEANQNELNQIFEDSANSRLLISTPISSSTPVSFQRKSTAPVTPPSNGSRSSEQAAYNEYRDAGEYWNKYPKTDYTYSKLSPHRREIAPGMVAMPNMSRTSLEHHHGRVDDMVQRNPSQESYIRTRYQSKQYQRKHQNFDYVYDSQDEVDVLNDQRRRYTSTIEYRRQSIISWIFTTIVTTFWSSWTACTSVFGQRESDLYYTRIEDEPQGVFMRFLSFVAKPFLAVFRCIYTVISSVLFLDSWLLKSSTANGGNKKRALLLVLILLPLLLLAAWNLHDEQERNVLIAKLPPIPLGLPLALTTVGNYVSELFNFLRNHSLTIKWANGKSNPQQSSSSHLHNDIGNTLKRSLTDAQYVELLSHINAYINTVVSSQKVTAAPTETEITKETAQLIGTMINENIVNYKYTLSATDVDRIAGIVTDRLRIELDAKHVPFTLSQVNLETISAAIKADLAKEPNVKKDVPPTNVDEIIFQILNSPKMINIVDQRLLTKTGNDRNVIAAQQVMIEKLRDEIAVINGRLADGLNMNNDFKVSLELLRSHQDGMASAMGLLESENAKRLDGLLEQIDVRIAALNAKQNSAIDVRVREVLMGVMGFKGSNGKAASNADIESWVRNIFVAKEFLELRLAEVTANLQVSAKDEIDRSAGILMMEIGERIKQDTITVIERNNEQILVKSAEAAAAVAGIKGAAVRLDEEQIKRIVLAALAVYDADKTGLVDYALESAGGEIISTRCTETYHTKTAQISIFGVPLWYPTNTPRTAISPAVQPGQCWAFQGFPGFLVLKLNSYVHVTGFTIEHIPRTLAPNGKIDSAPKTFTVWGLLDENDHEPQQLGAFEYLENGTSLQYFQADKATADLAPAYNIVELRIESNHGNPNYTCLYRFRVHGLPN